MKIMQESYEQRREREQRELEEHRKIAEAEARAMAVELLAKQPERFAEFQADHDKDKRLYEFRCERYGDFLAVFVARSEPLADSVDGRGEWWSPPSHKICATLNLGTSRKIELREGRAPDCQATVEFYMSSQPVDGKWTYVARPELPSVIQKRLLVLRPSQSFPRPALSSATIGPAGP